MKKTILSVFVVVAMSFAVVTAFSACGRNNMVGTWECDVRGIARMEFSSNGTFTQQILAMAQWNIVGHGTWTTSGNRLSLSCEVFGNQSFSFNITGNRLQFSDEFGNLGRTFTRVQ
ncbi:MAG: hypothetical protein FWC71_02935 [Defluviitaleaceae bacterium]|nr:hypothetical protein [Defluviitaleaceae bacterium]